MQYIGWRRAYMVRCKSGEKEWLGRFRIFHVVSLVSHFILFDRLPCSSSFFILCHPFLTISLWPIRDRDLTLIVPYLEELGLKAATIQSSLLSTGLRSQRTQNTKKLRELRELYYFNTKEKRTKKETKKVSLP